MVDLGLVDNLFVVFISVMVQTNYRYLLKTIIGKYRYYLIFKRSKR